jgi:hypothetical protein
VLPCLPGHQEHASDLVLVKINVVNARLSVHGDGAIDFCALTPTYWGGALLVVAPLMSRCQMQRAAEQTRDKSTTVDGCTSLSAQGKTATNVSATTLNLG